jgi:hypothetical protein
MRFLLFSFPNEKHHIPAAVFTGCYYLESCTSRRLSSAPIAGFPLRSNKALKGEAIVCYCEPLITQQMKASGSPFGVKIDEKKDHHPIYHLGKMYDAMMLFNLASIKNYKDSH